MSCPIPRFLKPTSIPAQVSVGDYQHPRHHHPHYSHTRSWSHQTTLPFHVPRISSNRRLAIRSLAQSRKDKIVQRNPTSRIDLQVTPVAPPTNLRPPTREPVRLPQHQHTALMRRLATQSPRNYLQHKLGFQTDDDPFTTPITSTPRPGPRRNEPSTSTIAPDEVLNFNNSMNRPL